MAELPAPAEGIVLTHFIVSTDVPRSAAFYSDVLGGEVVLEGEPTIVQLANSWVIINVGGGPTEDKPEVVLEAPKEPNLVSAFLNIRWPISSRSTRPGARRAPSSSPRRSSGRPRSAATCGIPTAT